MTACYLISECKELLSAFHAVNLCETEQETLHMFFSKPQYLVTALTSLATTYTRLCFTDFEFMVKLNGRAFRKEKQLQAFDITLYCSTIVPAPKYGVNSLFLCNFTLKHTKYSVIEKLIKFGVSS